MSAGSKTDEEFAKMARRIIRAYARRAAEADPDLLASMVGLQRGLSEAIDEVVVRLRLAGYSWQQIADELGITRQTAHKRWGRQAAAYQEEDTP